MNKNYNGKTLFICKYEETHIFEGIFERDLH